MKFRLLYLISISICLGGTVCAQETFPVNGVQDKKHLFYVFKNAKIFVDHKTIINNGTLIIRDGIIEEVSEKADIPVGAIVYDLQGKYIYPGLIDAFTDYGMPEIKKAQSTPGYPQFLSNTKGAYHWNQAIRPEFSANEIFNIDVKKAEELRKLGFGAVQSVFEDGIARGTAAFVTLAEDKEHKIIVKPAAAAHYTFTKGSSTQDYPSSQMGSIALLRQAYLDGIWYKGIKNKKELNISLESWNNIQDLPQIFKSDDKQTALRADKVGDEFGVQYIIKGSGDEYQRINEIKATKAPFILPVNFPAPYDVQDPYDALILTLHQLKHWELAPTNPAAFEKAEIPFALTTTDLKDKKDFWKNLRKAIEHGLTEEQALKALTTTPAEFLKVSDKVGSLKKGMLANFIITSKSLFDKNNVIYENWIQGGQYKVNNYEVFDIRGTYDLKIGLLSPIKLNVAGELSEPSVTTGDSVKSKALIKRNGNLITLQIERKDTGKTSDIIRLSGSIEDKNWKGNGQLSSGEWVKWTALFVSDKFEESKKDSTPKLNLSLGEVFYPNKEYGWKELPKAKDVLIKNATVWTNEKEGILKNTDVLVTNGKISNIKAGINPDSLGLKDIEIIDAQGKYLTCGIIDEHSHIAISRGVNEGTQSVTSEVRIGDVIDADDIDIYRQLAGGVTTSQLLHGSANAIGGQSALIKLKWGLAPEQLKFPDAPPFIKFALGENVKQSNWGDRNTIRFPQTRMGVEQVYVDAFTRAKEYEKARKKNSEDDQSEKVRQDLELDALVEILNKKRHITCHSYVQSEINMLMHLADSMGFKVNTFTHILEGYKVADKMKKHGAGASTFADWWAYKYEVIEAIPYNAAILTNMGVVTAINSDDGEMGRRLNQEAAKAVKYGGLSEEEAFKLCTLNPAILLHIDNKVGSIKTGKDADLVLWSDHPLSIYAKAEKTFVDGVCYYDLKKDEQLRIEIQKERGRIISKMLDAKKKGEVTQKPAKGDKERYHCEH